MSLFSAGFIKSAKDWGLLGDDVQFWEGGYLFLATREKETILKRNTALQQDLGASIRLMWDPTALTLQPSLCVESLMACAGRRQSCCLSSPG